METTVDERYAYKNITIELLLEKSTWEVICPFLTCCGGKTNTINCKSLTTNSSIAIQTEINCCSKISQAASVSCKNSLRNRGYFKVPASQIQLNQTDAHIVELLARGVFELMKYGFSPMYLLMYDESWILTDMFQNFFNAVTDRLNQSIGDFYIFVVVSDNQLITMKEKHVDSFNSAYQPGGPHRDRPTAGASSFRGDLPLYCSVWMALTESTTSNSCLYMIPIAHDMGYYSEGEALNNNDIRIQHVIAHPLTSGSLLGFSHRIVHWGSQLEPSQNLDDADTIKESSLGTACAQDGKLVELVPRVAFTTAFAHDSFEKAYFDHETYPLICTPLGLRLGLICGQLIQYEHLAPLAKHDLALTRRIFHSQKIYFNSEYYDKISSKCQMLAFIKRNSRSANS